MAEFLSPEWIAELDVALRAAENADDGPLTLEQVVSDVPRRGVVRYRLVLSHGAAVVSESNDARVDVRLTTDYETAVAIARGDANAQVALAFGRLRIGGDSDALVRHADQLARLADVNAQLRRTTTFPTATDAAAEGPSAVGSTGDVG